jgi:thioredoxin reductase
VEYRWLEARGVDRPTGAGVCYGAASTEAAAMAGARVVVVDGATSAGQAALHLSTLAAEVVIVVRAPTSAERMSRYLVDRIEESDRIQVRTRSWVSAVEGRTRLEQVRLAGGEAEVAVEASGMFVFIGAQPRTDWLGEAVATDAHGFVPTGVGLRPDRWGLERDPYLLETSLPGVFAVGDVRATSVKRSRLRWGRAPSPCSSSTRCSAAWTGRSAIVQGTATPPDSRAPRSTLPSDQAGAALSRRRQRVRGAPRHVPRSGGRAGNRALSHVLEM